MSMRIATGIVVLSWATSWCLNKNQSVQFLQDASRNASTDVDAAYHNPAGLAFLPGNGFHVSAGNQVALQDPVVEEESPALRSQGLGSYEGDVRIWALPTLSAVQRMDDLSFYLHAAPLSGGGKASYGDGLPMFDDMVLGFAQGVAASTRSFVDAFYEQQLAAAGIAGQHVTEGSTISVDYARDATFSGSVATLAGTVGCAWRMLPSLSASIGYRFAYARNHYVGSLDVSKLDARVSGSKGLDGAGVAGSTVDATIEAAANHAIDSLWRDVSVDVEQTGIAHGVVVGLDFKPDERWNVGMRFEWNGELELENTSSTIQAPDALLPYLAAYGKGAKTKATEPMVLAGGVSCKPVPRWTLEASATWGLARLVDHDGREDDYHNSLLVGVGTRYALAPRLEGALGYAYDATSKDEAARTELDPDYPCHYVSTGLGFQATPRLRVDGGAMYGLVLERHATSAASGARQSLDSRYVTLGLAVEWRPAI